VRAVETVLALVIVATAVATFARRLRAPAAIPCWSPPGWWPACCPGVPTVAVTPQVIGLIVLPPLTVLRR